jgi:hypothetical protein
MFHCFFHAIRCFQGNLEKGLGLKMMWRHCEVLQIDIRTLFRLELNNAGPEKGACII